MNDLPAGEFSTVANPSRVIGRTITRVGPILLIVIWLLTIIGGIVLFVSGLAGQQEEARLAAAPICAAGQVDGCRLDEQVTVVDLNTYYSGRGPSTRIVKVQAPYGSTQSVQDHDGDFFSVLYVTEDLNAELGKGSIIRLDDGAGHYLFAEDSPVVIGGILPLSGTFFIIAGGLLLAISVRDLLRQRRANR